MSYHHHHSHHHSHCQPPPPPQPCCSSCHCSCSSAAAPIPPSSASDQLLQAIAVHLLQPQPHPQPQPRYGPNPPAPDAALHSLHRRVAALESYISLYPPPAAGPRRGSGYRGDYEYDRRKQGRGLDPHVDRRAEAAARAIQLAFRRFLIRRSQTLRQLRELAVIRSHAASLRMSVSQGRRLSCDPKLVSRKAMELMLRLDGIQECDPMLREGKRATAKELTRVLDFVDHVLVEEQKEAFAAMDISDGRVDDPSPPRVRRVRFAGEGFRRTSAEGLEDELEGGEDEAEASDGIAGRAMGRQRVVKRSSGRITPVPVHMEPSGSIGQQ